MSAFSPFLDFVEAVLVQKPGVQGNQGSTHVVGTGSHGSMLQLPFWR